jgi:hypothetical protein
MLLDVGMTIELSQHDRYIILDFFKALAISYGREVAKCTFRFFQVEGCPNPTISIYHHHYHIMY